MRTTIFSMNISLDGYYSGPNNELDWSIADEELHQEFADLLSGSDLALFGRVTYQMLADYWPFATEDPSLPPGGVAFANAINSIPKIVYSRTLEKADWNTKLIKEIKPADILKMKQEPGKKIEASSASVATQLLQFGLLDEVVLFIHPVIIGGGKRLFDGVEGPIRLKQLSSKTLGSGVVIVSYQVEHA